MNALPRTEQRLPLSYFEALCKALMEPSAYSHRVEGVERIDTHISVILLAGCYAYKLKKPVRLPFLDFSTLELRHAACLRELELNRRTAPEHYLGVDPVTMVDGMPTMGGEGTAVEYAVKMRRFPPDSRLDEVLARGKLDVDSAQQLADAVAAFHRVAEVAPEASAWATPGAISRDIADNFTLLEKHAGVAGVDGDRLSGLRHAQMNEARRLDAMLAQRKRNGFVRDCHGDLHLANIVLVDGCAIPFDCIEFNDAFRWIDVMSDLAFLLMDLEDRGAHECANTVLNRYLAATGDYAGLAVLRLYQGYRALVRAKVLAIGLAQGSVDEEAASKSRSEFDAYLSLAEGYANTDRSGRSPALIITCGLSGSGKSSLASRLARSTGAVIVRSDVERRRLFDARTTSTATRYGAAATGATYDQLAECTRLAFDAGYDVIADAAFLRRTDRDRFAAVAREAGCRFRVLVAAAPEEILRARVVRRARTGGDPSEADEGVLEQQLLSSELPAHDEEARTRMVDTTEQVDLADLQVWLESPEGR